MIRKILSACLALSLVAAGAASLQAASLPPISTQGVVKLTARNMEGLVGIGDSRIAQLHTDVGTSQRRSAYSMISWALALSGQNMSIASNLGVSGDRSDQVLARVDQAIAANAGVVILWAGVNNLAQANPTSITGSITGTTLTATTAGTINIGDEILGSTNIVAGTTVTALLTGTQSAANATYQLSQAPSANITSQTLYAGKSYTASNNGPRAGQVVTSSQVGQAIFDDLKFATEKMRLAGLRVIIVYEMGAGGGINAYGIGQMLKLNQLLAEYARVTPNVYGFDMPSIMWDPAASTSTTIAFKSGYLRNAAGDVLTHPNIVGGYWAAKGDGVNPGLASLLQRFAPPRMVLPSAEFQVASSSDAGNLLTNPLFKTQTGGTKTPGTGTITGNAPSGWRVINTVGSPAVDISYAASTTGVGQDIILTITFAAAGDKVRLDQALAFTSPYFPKSGDFVQGVGRMTITSGSANLQQAGLELDYFNGTMIAIAEDLQSDGTRGPLPSDTMSLTLQTERMPIGTSTTGAYVVPWFWLVASQAGSTTVRFSQCQVYRFKPAS